LRFDNLLYDNITNFYKSESYISSQNLSNETDIKFVGGGGFYIFRITPLKDFSDINLQFVKIMPWDLKSETDLINLKISTSNKQNIIIIKQQDGFTTNTISSSIKNNIKYSFMYLFIVMILA